MHDDYHYDERVYRDDRGYPEDRGYPDYRDEPRRRPPPPRDRRGPPPRDYRGPPPGDGRGPPPPPRDQRGPLPPPPRERDMPPGKKRISYKCIGGMVVAVIALILLFIFMSHPWYFVSYSGDFREPNQSLEYSIEYKIDKATYDMKMGYENITFQLKNETSYNSTAEDIKGVMDNTYLIILLSMIIIIIAIIIIPIAAIGKIPHVIGMIFLILGILFLLIIPLYFFFTFPPALETHLDQTSRTIGPPDWAPLNQTLRYNGDFMSSGSGHEFYDIDFNGDDDRYDYEVKWEPGLAFWLMFVPLIMMVIAQIAYGSGKQDLMPRSSGARGGRPAPPPPPPPRERDRQVRDYGPPRPMRDEDYNYIPTSRPPPRRDYGYREQPPPRRGGYDYEYDASYREPPPPPQRQSGYDYGYEQDYDYGHPPPRPPRRREYY